jgi:hypothetical protein
LAGGLHALAGMNRAGSALSAPTVARLEQQFTRLTQILYDTSVPLAVLEREVDPYLAPNIQFIDPLARVRGHQRFKTGLRGFHCSIFFDFDITQLHVRMNERGDGGRAIVDGIMNLRQLQVYTYPLRTILVYEFVTIEDSPGFQITLLEEMWSLGDLIQNAPLIGPVYDRARFVSGYILLGFFWLSCAVAKRIPWSKATRSADTA